MSVRLRWLVSAVLLLVLAPACSRSEAGAPVSGAEERRPTVSISNPRELAGLAADPCSAFTPQQLDAISPALQPTPDATVYGAPACVWRDTEDLVSLSVEVDNTSRQGIEVLYLQPDVERIEVADYPAGQFGESGPDTCAVSVGVAPDEQLIVDFSRGLSDRPEQQQACDYVNKLAAMVIEKLPPKR